MRFVPQRLRGCPPASHAAFGRAGSWASSSNAGTVGHGSGTQRPCGRDSWRSSATHSGTPPLTQHAHQPQPGRPARPPLPWAQRRHVAQCAGWDRLVRGLAHPQEPQRRHGHGSPPPRRPGGSTHAGAVPLPPRACGALKALVAPGAQPIPAGITGLRRQSREEPPGGFVALLPARQPGTGHLVACTGDARTAPPRPCPRGKTRQRPPAIAAALIAFALAIGWLVACICVHISRR